MWPFSNKGQWRVAGLYLLPKNILTRLVGYLAASRLPHCLLQAWIRAFIHYYRIDMAAYQGDLDQYRTFEAFFTRMLKPGARPVDNASASIVSPVDGYAGASGEIRAGRLLQAKGLEYSLASLVQLPQYAALFTQGDFLTCYLSPADYHRIHMPLSAQVVESLYLPGTLFPVNPLAVHHIPNLFAINERLITLLRLANGRHVAVVKIGATIVGKIRVVYDRSKRGPKMVHRTYQDLWLHKGEQLGYFSLGSTVILLFEKATACLAPLPPGSVIRMGRRIGQLATRN